MMSSGRLSCDADAGASVRLGEARHVARDEVHLEVDPGARPQASERRHVECMRDQVDVEARAGDAIDGEARAVDGNRALGGNEARERRGRLDLEAEAALARRHLVDAIERDDGADAVDVPAHQVPAKPVGQPQRQLEIDVAAAVEPRGAAQRLGGHVERDRAPLLRRHGEAAAVDRDAVADRNLRDVERSGDDGETQAVAFGRGGGDPADRLHDSGEHQAFPFAIRAMMRRSSPMRVTSKSASATRSASVAMPPGKSAMPRAGSPMIEGAT